MTTRLTASKLELAVRCAFPWSPGAQWVNRQSAAASLGTALHAYVEALVTSGAALSSGQPFPKIADVAASHGLDAEQGEALVRMVTAWLAEFKPLLGWRAEVTFAYDPSTDTAREIGASLGRDYSAARPGEVVGTVDIVSMGGDCVEVYDWKCGQQDGLAPAAEHEQLRFLGLAAARAYGVSRARIVIGHVQESGASRDVAELEAWDLDEIAEHVREVAERIAAESAEPTPGAWCSSSYCPCVATCPAIQAAADTMLATLAPVSETAPRHLPIVASVEAIESREHAGWLYERAVAIRKLAETVEKAAKAYCDEVGPIPLSDGRELRCQTETRETVIVDDITIEILKGRLGELGGTIVEMRLAVTKKAIADAARTVAGTGKPGAELERQVLGDLRQADRVAQEKEIRHRVGKPGKKEIAA